MLFAILFGLSMDYEVFLITRIQEEYAEDRRQRTAVRNGLAATGKTITAAALIMILVFGSFILGGERVIKEFGLGLAAGILIDAVLIRMAIVPVADVPDRQGQLVVPGAGSTGSCPTSRVDPDLPAGGAGSRGPAAPARREPEPVAGLTAGRRGRGRLRPLTVRSGHGQPQLLDRPAGA